jgi:penicillin-binding protein-related factor A (putative recombinase)
MPIITRASQKPEPEIILTMYDGKVHLETVGFEGKSCTEATAFLLKNAKDQQIKFKPEYMHNTAKKSEGRLLA